MKRKVLSRLPLGVSVGLLMATTALAVEPGLNLAQRFSSVDEIVYKTSPEYEFDSPISLMSLVEPAPLALATLGGEAETSADAPILAAKKAKGDHARQHAHVPSCRKEISKSCSSDSWSDNLAFFFAGDGWKAKPDDDHNNNFGFRTGVNGGFGSDELPIRLQLGSSFGAYDFHGREEGRTQSTETQLFITGGVYQRSDISCGRRLSWGVVWDQMFASGWGEAGANDVQLAQVRFQAGYALNECNELGIWGAFHVDDDLVNFQQAPAPGTRVRTLDQWNLYWKRHWDFGADTTAYVGLSESPADVVIGLTGHAPLSHRVALFGNVHYMIPGTSPGDAAPNGVENSYSEEYCNVSFGIVFYPGYQAASRNVSGNQGLPLLPVADNGTFAVKAPRGNL
jgi:hypothetical protein